MGAGSLLPPHNVCNQVNVSAQERRVLGRTCECARSQDAQQYCHDDPSASQRCMTRQCTPSVLCTPIYNAPIGNASAGDAPS